MSVDLLLLDYARQRRLWVLDSSAAILTGLERATRCRRATAQHSELGKGECGHPDRGRWNLSPARRRIPTCIALLGLVILWIPSQHLLSQDLKCKDVTCHSG